MNPLVLLGILLIIPISSFGVFDHVTGLQDDLFRSHLSRPVPTPPGWLEQYTAASLCEDSDIRRELASSCRKSDVLRWSKTASGFTGGLVIVAVLGILATGPVVRRDRSRLLAIFRPGLHLVLWSTFALMLLNAALLVAALYYLGTLVGTIPTGVIGMLGLGSIGAAFSMMKAALTSVTRAEARVLGTEVSPEQEPELWETVRDVAQSVNATDPDHLVLGLEPNFFVTETGVRTVNGNLLTGRTIYCSVGLAGMLTVPELRGVLVHEFGHFVGRDTEFSSRFLPIYRGTATVLEAMWERSNGWKALAIWPTMRLMEFFLERFALPEFEIGRDRELEADRLAGLHTGREVIAAALCKISTFAPMFDDAVERCVQSTTRQGGDIIVGETIGAAFQRSITDRTTLFTANLTGDHATFPAHPTDSHPALRERLAALGLRPKDALHLIETASEEPSAASLIRTAHYLDESLSAFLMRLLTDQSLAVTPAP